jgi:hypothetical protein
VSELLAKQFTVGGVAVDCAIQTANATIPSGTRGIVLVVKTRTSAAGFELKETKNVETGHGCGGKDLKSAFCIDGITRILASLCRRTQ